jgi:IS4 transposase
MKSRFYYSKYLTLLQAHNYAYVVPIIQWGGAIQQELSEGWSRVIDHDLTGKLDGHSWTVDFPVYIDCTYLNGRDDEHGVARHGYAADAPFIETPRDARYYYSTFRYRVAYHLSEQAIATATTRDATVRLLYVVVSLLLQNAWRYRHYESVATPRRGGVASGGGLIRIS